MRQGINTKCPKRDDNYNTPPEAFDLIFSYIPRDKKVWCPFYNNGDLSIPKDIDVIHENKDFFAYVPEKWDYIVDNPPYSIKKQIFERCLSLGKPFALLVPFDSLERQYVSSMLKHNDFTVIIPHTRYKFNEMSFTPPFKCVFICVGFNLGRQIIFE